MAEMFPYGERRRRGIAFIRVSLEPVITLQTCYTRTHTYTRVHTHPPIPSPVDSLILQMRSEMRETELEFELSVSLF